MSRLQNLRDIFEDMNRKDCYDDVEENMMYIAIRNKCERTNCLDCKAYERCCAVFAEKRISNTTIANYRNYMKEESNMLNIDELVNVIPVRYYDGVEELKKIEVGNWIDLRSAERVVMKKGDFRLISLGISMKLPDGYEAHVLPRSSTFKNYGIIMANSMGIIDTSYCGENDIWKFPAYATRDCVIEKNDRIAQFRIVKSMDAYQFSTALPMGNDRGGFGSTGVK